MPLAEELTWLRHGEELLMALDAVVMTASKKLLDGPMGGLHNLVSLLLTNKTLRSAVPG